jgi:CRISPR-associated protein Cmr1
MAATPRILSYRLSFNTPAFLGNAEQQAQWRTPPIKALLRQWWRVAYAADHPKGVSVAEMRRAEGRLFGVAADGKESNRSLVRIRLSRWDKGRLTNWSGLDQDRVAHPEVKNREGRPAPVGAQLYLGYGPLIFSQGTALKGSAAIQATESADLSLAFPSGDESDRLHRALWLMHQYGTLGGRSRNGWGSFSLTPLDTTPALLSGAALDKSLTMPWRDALAHDWAQAIGCDDEHDPLIWQTEALADWKAVMRRLAEIKIGLRTQFKFHSGKDASAPEERHWLSYPVTNHSVRAWGNNARLPNSLRFKVRSESDGKLRGVIFHVPCLPPAEFRPDRQAIVRVWQQVHQYLDTTTALKRISA